MFQRARWVLFEDCVLKNVRGTSFALKLEGGVRIF